MDMNFKRKYNPADLFRGDPDCSFEDEDVIFGTIRMDRRKVAGFIDGASDLMDDGIPIIEAFDYVVRCIRDEFLLFGEERSEEEIRTAVHKLVFRDDVDL
jgi:hypothetical protein